jgi:hypothetical protein
MSCYAQAKTDLVNILHLEQDLVKLEERTTMLIKKQQPQLAKIKGLRQFHVLYLKLDKGDTKKADFWDHSFLYKLKCTYYRIRSNPILGKEKPYLQGKTFITDSIGNPVATSDAFIVSTFSKYSYRSICGDIKFIRKLFNRELDSAFYLISPFFMHYLVGIKDDKLYGIEEIGYIMHPWEEFMNNYFDDWLDESLL